MHRKTAIKVDRYLQKLADETGFINHKYAELQKLILDATEVELSYDEVKYAVNDGEYTCNSTRGCRRSQDIEIGDRVDKLQKQHDTFYEAVNDFLIMQFGNDWIDYRSDVYKAAMASENEGA